MNITRGIAAFIFLTCGFVVSDVLAQNQNQDYCQRHPELFDNNGKLTLEAHKKLNHLDGSEWWYDSRAKEWKQWPSKTNVETLEEHHELTGGPYSWYDSQAKEEKLWHNQDKKMTLDCYKKLHSGPNWWYDSQAKEWKRWPTSN
ncbi:MAG: hypothetical protein AB7P17_10035 [Nitrospirales bacterium]|nr:hypothetical protein [Nitrospirales bacterium]